MERLASFFSAAFAERGQKFVKVDGDVYELIQNDGTGNIRFTLDRDNATNQEGLELMGLDHPLVLSEINRWREAPPENIGISVAGDIDETVLLSIWMIEISSGNNERRVVIQPIAVKLDGARVPSVEHQYERYFQAPLATPQLTPERRVGLFSQRIEPALQRELRHRNTANGSGSYSAEMIGYVEIV
jgi:hypothetical protein